MKWVSTKPDRPGYWWWRARRNGENVHVKKVIESRGLLWAEGILLDDSKGQWSDSPIPTPEEE